MAQTGKYLIDGTERDGVVIGGPNADGKVLVRTSGPRPVRAWVDPKAAAAKPAAKGGRKKAASKKAGGGSGE